MTYNTDQKSFDEIIGGAISSKAADIKNRVIAKVTATKDGGLTRNEASNPYVKLTKIANELDRNPIRYNRVTTGKPEDIVNAASEQIIDAIDTINKNFTRAIEKVDTELSSINSGIKVLDTRITKLESSNRDLSKRVSAFESSREPNKHQAWKESIQGTFSVLDDKEKDHGASKGHGGILTSGARISLSRLGTMGASIAERTALGIGTMVTSRAGMAAGAAAVTGLGAYGLYKYFQSPGAPDLQGALKSPPKFPEGLIPPSKIGANSSPDNPIWSWLKRHNPFDTENGPASGDPGGAIPRLGSPRAESWDPGGAIPRPQSYNTDVSRVSKTTGEMLSDLQSGNPTGKNISLSVDKHGKVDPQLYYNSMVEKFANSQLNGFVPQDGAKFGIKTGSPEEWARFATMLTKQESNFSIHAKGPSGEQSYGLSQMKPGEYGLKTMDDVLDPNKASGAMVKQFEKYIIPSKHIAGRGSGEGTYGGWRGAAAYFGPLRRTNEFFQHGDWFKENIKAPTTSSTNPVYGKSPYINLERPPTAEELRKESAIQGKNATAMFDPTQPGASQALETAKSLGITPIAYWQGGGDRAFGEKELDLTSDKGRASIKSTAEQHMKAGYGGIKIDNLHRLKTTDDMKGVFDSVPAGMKIVPNGNSALLNQFLEKHPEYKDRIIYGESENLASGNRKEELEGTKGLTKKGVPMVVHEWTKAIDKSDSATREQAAALANSMPGVNVNLYNQKEMPGKGEIGGISGRDNVQTFTAGYQPSETTAAKARLGVGKFTGRDALSGIQLEEEKKIKATGVNLDGYTKLTSAPKWNVMEGRNPYSESKNIVSLKTDFGDIRVHKTAAPAFSGFYADMRSAGAPIRKLGSLNIRQKRGSGSWSSHSYGMATDIDDSVMFSKDMLKWVESNPERFHGILNKWGMKWNPWSSSPRTGDPGHVEYGGMIPESTIESISTTSNGNYQLSERYKSWLQSVYPSADTKPVEGTLKSEVPGTEIAQATRVEQSQQQVEQAQQAQQEQQTQPGASVPDFGGPRLREAVGAPDVVPEEKAPVVGGMSQETAKGMFGKQAVEDAERSAENMVTPQETPYQGKTATPEQKVAAPPEPSPKEESGQKTEEAPQMKSRPKKEKDDNEPIVASNRSGVDKRKPTVSNGGSGDSNRGYKNFCNV